MKIVVWVFIGIEGVVVFLGCVKKYFDIGKVSILVLFIMILFYVLIFVLLFGIMLCLEFVNLKILVMVYVLEKVVGYWGVILVNFGVIILVFGVIFVWILFVVELLY